MKRNYILYGHKTKKLRDKFLLIAEHGSWSVLSEKDYADLRKHRLKQTKLNELKRKGIIINKKTIEKAVELTKQKNQFLFNGTSLHIAVPTLRCNHTCVYCHSKAKPQKLKGYDMDKETAKKTVDFIFQSPSKAIAIEFQGGEPLLSFEIVEFIIDYAKKLNKKHKKNLRFDLVTNLSAMDHDILKYLINNKIGLCTSLDGPKELHDKNRKLLGGSSYEKTVHWIKEIKGDYNYNTGALMVTTKFSLPFWKEIIEEYRKNKLEWIKLRFLDNLGYAQKNFSKISYTTEEYIDFWLKSMEYLVALNKSYLLGERMTTYILAKLKGKWINYVDFQSPCGAAIGQLAYAQDGSIYTCDEARMFEMFKLGNVRKDNYKDILASEQTCSIIAASTNDCLLCDACVYKPFCGVCPVCTYASTGTLIPKLAMDDRCKIYKAMFNYIFENLIFSPQHKKVFNKWTRKLNEIM